MLGRAVTFEGRDARALRATGRAAFRVELEEGDHRVELLDLPREILARGGGPMLLCSSNF